MPHHVFKNRADAARQLIAELPPEIDETWCVLGLPRGGVPIAAAVARHLGARLDILLVRKVSAPGNPEVAVAAVTGPGDSHITINGWVQRLCGLSAGDIRKLAVAPVQELEARRRLWRGSEPQPDLRTRDVLVVDDGAATGTKLEAALNVVDQQEARTIAMAVPVALNGALEQMDMAGVRVICPHPASKLVSVGSAYRDFPRVTDHEVHRVLAETRTNTG